MTDVMIVMGLMVLIYMGTQLIKTVIDLILGKKNLKEGKAKRRRRVIFNRLILPAVPVSIGVLLGALLPIRPVMLMEFVNEYVTGFSATVVYGAYGAIMGQFSDYGYSKVKSFIEDFRFSRGVDRRSS